MNFHRKSTFYFIAFVLAINFAMITGKPIDDDDLPITTDKERKTTTTGGRVRKTTTEDHVETTSSKPKPTSFTNVAINSAAALSSSSQATELPQGDQADSSISIEPNVQSRPEMQTSASPMRTSTVPPLLHTTSEGSSESQTTSTSTTTTTTTTPATMSIGGNDHGSIHQTSTEATLSTTTKGHNAATGLFAAQFSCFVASALLLVVR